MRTAGADPSRVVSGFVRGGIYDRLQVKQGADLITFRDLDYFNLYGLEAAGAPRSPKSGIFIVRSPAFSAAYPWKLAFLGNRVDRATGHRTFAVFERSCGCPPSCCRAAPAGRGADCTLGAHLEVQGARDGVVSRCCCSASASSTPSASGSRGCHAQEQVAGQRLRVHGLGPVDVRRLRPDGAALDHAGADLVPRAAVPVDLVAVPWSDPAIFVFWIFIIATVFPVRARLFCGWLCPFGFAVGGALQDRRLDRASSAGRAAAAALARPPSSGSNTRSSSACWRCRCSRW